MSKLNFSKSLGPIMAQKRAEEQARVNDILHPNTKGRLSFASFGDPPTATKPPQRRWFPTDEQYQGALRAYKDTVRREREVYRKSLR